MNNYVGKFKTVQSLSDEVSILMTTSEILEKAIIYIVILTNTICMPTKNRVSKDDGQDDNRDVFFIIHWKIVIVNNIITSIATGASDQESTILICI